MGVVIVVGVAAVGVTVAAHAVACWIWPFANCRRCDGSGKRRSPSGKTFRLCRRCKGSGRRLRFGRWAWNYFARVRRDSQ